MYKKDRCNNPLFQSLPPVNIVRGSIWMCSSSSSYDWLLLSKDDPLNRPHTNLLRSVSSFPSAFSVMPPATRTGSWYRPPVVYWSCCWVTRGIMVRLLVIDFQRARSHFPTMDVIIYSASVSSWAFIFLGSCPPLSMLSLQLLYI